MRRLSLLFALCACQAQSFAPEREPLPAAPAPVRVSHEPPPGTAARMADHFEDARKIKDAVIAGELLDLRAPARRLAERADPVPASWRPFVAGNVELARAALAADDLDAAARAAGALAGNCGECHAAVGAGPRAPDPGAPPPSAPHDTARHMLRHQWAADQMWEALVSRSDDAWRAGAAALTDAPLRTDDLTADVELPADIARLGDRVHELGARARTTTPWPARAQLYGEFLATCATCHKGGC
jgi:mono/diheme cytochrome c family protein